jgi:hypothetical protein
MKWDPIVPIGPPEDQPLTRDDHSAVNFNDQAMIVFGGFVDGGERTNELWSYSYMRGTGGTKLSLKENAPRLGRLLILLSFAEIS